VTPSVVFTPEAEEQLVDPLMAGLRITAEIARESALSNIIESIARPLDATALDEPTLERALDTCAHSVHHQVGTCRMGRDQASVVDPQLCVRGVNGLRIAEASVMPTIIRGHTHAPSVLIGEKLADMVLLAANSSITGGGDHHLVDRDNCNSSISRTSN